MFPGTVAEAWTAVTSSLGRRRWLEEISAGRS